MQLALLVDSASLFLTSFFSTSCVVAALLWLTWRAYTVVTKPLDELVGLLGFEIPLGPRVDLAGVKADSVTLHWSAVEERRANHKYEVQVNGTVIGELPYAENSIHVSNLRPDHRYIIRVVTVNTLDFRAASEPVRLRTKPASSGDFFDLPSPMNQPDAEDDGTATTGPPVLRSFKMLPEIHSTSGTPPPMTRETSNGPSLPKRTSIGRRVSPATFTADVQQAPIEELEDSGETQQQLTRRLEELGRDIAEVEKQLNEEEQEALLTKDELIKERDDLRTTLKDRDNISRDLRKQVNVLERENGAAQGKRTAQDRALHQKRGEMQKTRDDIIRWGQEAGDFARAVEQFALDRQRLIRETEEEKQSLQDKHVEEQNALKLIEDDIRDRNTQVKKLEREKNESPDIAESNEQPNQISFQEMEEDQLHHSRIAMLDAEYKRAYEELEDARRLSSQAYMQLQVITAEHQRQLAYAAPSRNTNTQSLSRASSHRQKRPSSALGAANGSGSGSFAFPIAPGAPFGSGMSTLPEGFTASRTPFFNINNGMTIDRSNEPSSFSTADIERLTGGAPMSPSAGAELLPADLLSTADEEMPSLRHDSNSDESSDGRQHSNGGMLPGLGAFASSNFLPGLGAAPIQSSDIVARGPVSPVSVSSRSPSVFASPGASASNLAFQSPDQLDADGRSVRSGRSMSVRAPSTGAAQSGSRFAQILGFRQRGKTMADDGLSLGSLSKTQSQSMPKDGAQDDPAYSNRRRNSSHSGNFLGLGRSATTKPTASDELEAPKGVATRRRPFNMFGSKDGWPTSSVENRPVSPRPVSTHSTELPRPSGDGGWGRFLANESFSSRASPLSTDWNRSQPSSLSQMRGWGSRHPSRRPSVQVGDGASLPEDIMEADTDNDDTPHRPLQAPIGTKPSTQSIEPPPSPPRLNPAAKDFKSLFLFGDKKDKSEKSSKSRGKDKETPRSDAGPSTPNGDGSFNEDLSPTRSRMSRDTHSMTTVESSAADSSARNSLDHTPSYANSDVPTPSLTASAGKESFMSRLSRKSSSGLFVPSVFSRDKKQRNADKARESMLGETYDEDLLSQSVESMGKSSDADRDEGTTKLPKPTSRSWSSRFTTKIGKAKDKDKASNGGGGGDKTPSASEASLNSASETNLVADYDGEEDG